MPLRPIKFCLRLCVTVRSVCRLILPFENGRHNGQDHQPRTPSVRARPSAEPHGAKVVAIRWSDNTLFVPLMRYA